MSDFVRSTSVLVPQEELDKLEQARKDLFKLFESVAWGGMSATAIAMECQKVTQQMWYVANRKWPKVEN